MENESEAQMSRLRRRCLGLPERLHMDTLQLVLLKASLEENQRFSDPEQVGFRTDIHYPSYGQASVGTISPVQLV
ncbi:hypothetical protein D3C80_1578150 [compost metagenome]